MAVYRDNAIAFENTFHADSCWIFIPNSSSSIQALCCWENVKIILTIIVWRALGRIHLTAVKWPAGLLRSDGKPSEPDRLRLTHISRQTSECMPCDVSCQLQTIWSAWFAWRHSDKWDIAFYFTLVVVNNSACWCCWFQCEPLFQKYWFWIWTIGFVSR